MKEEHLWISRLGWMNPSSCVALCGESAGRLMNARMNAIRWLMKPRRTILPRPRRFVCSSKMLNARPAEETFRGSNFRYFGFRIKTFVDKRFELWFTERSTGNYNKLPDHFDGWTWCLLRVLRECSSRDALTSNLADSNEKSTNGDIFWAVLRKLFRESDRWSIDHTVHHKWY